MRKKIDTAKKNYLQIQINIIKKANIYLKKNCKEINYVLTNID